MYHLNKSGDKRVIKGDKVAFVAAINCFSDLKIVCFIVKRLQIGPVSYTHLDVYKRQFPDGAFLLVGVPVHREQEWLVTFLQPDLVPSHRCGAERAKGEQTAMTA